MIVEETSAEIDQEKCGICKEDTSCDFATRCGHWFHESCLKAWFARQRFCPYCQQTMSASKKLEKIMYNLKKLKIDQTKANSALKFFDSYSKALVDNYNSDFKIPSCDIEIVETLILAGWDINDRIEGGWHLLRKLCKKNDMYRLIYLFEHGVDLKDNNENCKVVHNSARDHQIQADLNYFDSLVSHPSAEISADGNTQLHQACLDNNFENVKFLVASGSAVNEKNKRGITPLHFACSVADMEIINFLIEKGAEINCVDLEGKCPLYEALTSKFDRNDVLAKFLDMKANLKYLDQDRNNLLHVALIAQKFDNASLLIDRFDEINSLNGFDESPLHIAADLGPLSLIEKLLERNANAKLKDSDGNTPLHRAVTFNTVEVVRALLKDGKSEVNALNAKNETALFLALKRVGCSTFVQALSENGADLNIKNNDGKNVLDLALKSYF